jgi:predicted nucleic acid-binding protein
MIPTSTADTRVTPAVLVDTSALLALAHPRDQYHARSVELAQRHLNEGGRFVGTVMVLGELHAHLLHLAGPARARTVVSNVLRDPLYSWVGVDSDLAAAAQSRWLDRYADQRFSLIDAVSFEVMRRDKIGTAFAFDRHFRTAGFELLT